MERKLFFICSILLTFIIAYYMPINSQNSREINKRGVKLGEEKKYKEAIKEFDQAIKIRDKSAAKVYHNKGYAYDKMGKLKEAIKAYEEAWKRNPRQVVTGERLGFSHYRTENYERAVEVGEAVMRIDPDNEEVPQWLPDAYKKRLAARNKKREEEERRKREEARKKEEACEQKFIAQRKKEEWKEKYYITLDAMLRTGYYFGNVSHMRGLYYSSPKSYLAITDEGFVVDIPESLFARITPAPAFQMNIYLGKPWLGATSPKGLCEHREQVELLFKFKRGLFGFGSIVNHYDSDIAFRNKRKLWDVKAGIIFGFNKDKVEMRLAIYPKILIPDPKSSTGKTLDYGSFRIDYAYNLNQNVKLNILIYGQDFYLYCHSFDYFVLLETLYRQARDVADFYGIYDVGMGLTLSNLFYTGNDFDLKITFQWIERFYLRSLKNDTPYSQVPNGTTFFGLDINGWTKGKPFSGFRALSQVLTLRFDEQITKNFFMYQRVIFELADPNEDRHEFNLQIGIGVKG